MHFTQHLQSLTRPFIYRMEPKPDITQGTLSKMPSVPVFGTLTKYFVDYLQKIPISHTLSVTIVSPEYLRLQGYSKDYIDKYMSANDKKINQMTETINPQFYENFINSTCKEKLKEEDRREPSIIRQETKETKKEAQLEDFKNTGKEKAKDSRQSSIPSVLSNVWQKVVNIVNSSSSTSCSNTSEGNEQTENAIVELTEESHSPKLCKKMVANSTRGRGRGRGAKANLRGASNYHQKHRKERIKHDLSHDIQTDMDDWMDFEILGCSVDNQDEMDCEDYKLRDSRKEQQPEHLSCFLSRITGLQREPDEVDFAKLKIDCSPQSSITSDFVVKIIDSDLKKCNFKLRQDSYAESEDSFCIVFDNDSELESDSSSLFSEDEFDDDVPDRLPSKVQFDLNPTVHTMVKWDYAYRTARKGPWEEMARDRERFKTRIFGTKAILDPILSEQHRNKVWRNRFSTDQHMTN